MGILSYKPQANDNIFKFIFGTVKHHYELWPLVGSLAIWAVIVSSAITWNASKQDVWLNRANRTPPWDWTRVKDVYGKKQKMIDHSKWPIIPEVAELEEQMVKKAKEQHHR